MTESADVASASADLSSRPLSTGRRVCMVPFYLDNPYQRELVNELRRLNIAVETRVRLKGLLSKIWRGQSDPQVVHMHWLPSVDRSGVQLFRLTLFFLRIILLRLSGRELVWTVHNLYAHEGRFRWIQRWFSKGIVHCASSVIVHSRTAAELVAQEFDIKDRNKLQIVPHGNYVRCYPNHVSRAAARRQLGLDAHAPVLLFLGKIRPYKGVRELIEAFQELHHPTATLLVAGDPLNEDVWQELQAAARSPQVRLQRGYVPGGDVQLYMNAADAVVFPYQDVLTSGAVILAMSFGKACVAARIGCICDTLDDSGSFLYERDKPHSLREALQACLANVGRLHDMGQHNRERAEEWSWERVAEATAALYFPKRWQES